jgi:hypothetical protein
VRIDEHAAAEALEQLAGWIKLQDRRIGIAATETGGDAGPASFFSEAAE